LKPLFPVSSPGLARRRSNLDAARLSWVAAFLLGSVAAPLSSGGAAPKAQVTPTKIELGQINEGNTFERVLELKNVGDEKLILEDVKASCGCTTAAVDGTVELDPGEVESIRVTFNSKGMEGQVTKQVSVYTNDPEHRQLEVNLTADVHRPVRWEPKYVMLEKTDQNAQFEQVVSIQADFDLGMKVKDAFLLGGKLGDQPSKLFDLERLGERKENERDVVDLKVRLRPLPKPQKIQEHLVVVTNLPAGNDTLRIPIRGEITGRIVVYPQFAVLPPVNPGEESVKDVSVTAAEGTFTVLSAEVPDSPVTVEIIKQNEGKQYVLRLRYVGEKAGTNGVRNLLIHTDDEYQSLAEVPVRYHTRTQPIDAKPGAAAVPAAGIPKTEEKPGAGGKGN
jgi:translation initiation factor 1 (eIF-1/SUI1)